MTIMCTFNDKRYDIVELASTLCKAYDSGIMIKIDREIYTQLVVCIENSLRNSKGNIFAIEADLQIVANYLRQIAFIYYTKSSKWNDIDMYLAMLKAIAFTHRIDARDHEIVAKIKADYFSLNIPLETQEDTKIHNQIKMYTPNLYIQFLSR